MIRSAAARFALVVLAIALLWTGISFVTQREIIVWTDVATSGDVVTSEGTSIDVLPIGLVLLTIGLLVTATILVFEGYIRPVTRVEERSELEVESEVHETASPK